MENEFTAEVLNKNIESLVSSKEKLKNMRRAAKSVGTTAATEEIYREAKRLLKNN